MAQRRTLIDISVSLNPGILTWPGDPEFMSFSTSSIKNGDSCNVTRISMGSHAGTHIDAPAHFIHNGVSVDEISLDVLIGEALVVELGSEPGLNNNGVRTDEDGTNSRIEDNINEDHESESFIKKVITVDDLSTFDLQGVTRLLLKTPNSRLLDKGGFTSSFTRLSGDAARFLVDHGIRLVGIDYLSIDSPGSDDAHRVLLENGVVILETIDLSDVKPGRYELICLPLKLRGLDGAPARALLRVFEGP